ncbi:MAG: hypothetical protein R3B36_32845 [Polyangiaceae bacterium]
MLRSATSRGLVLAFALCATLAGPAYAAPKTEKVPPAEVETAEQLYAKLEYEAANAVAERVVKKNGLTHDQLTRAYRVLAVTYAVLEKEDQAKEAFIQLLTYDPEYQADPNLGPKVSGPFQEARGFWRAQPVKPKLEVSAQVSREGGSLRVVTRDPTKIVKKVQVGWRWTPTGDFATSEVEARGTASVEVEAAPSGRTRLDFYAQALDERDSVVFESGNPFAPKSAFAQGGVAGGAGPGNGKKTEGGSVFSSPIFWLLTGAAVVGGGAAVFFATRGGDGPSQAQLSPVLLCGRERCN